MSTKNAEQTRALSLDALVARELKTSAQNLAVRSGIKAGGDPVTWGKFAKYR